MAEDTHNRFTVYLEGHEGHRGNVLLRSFLIRVHRLEAVLGKLERAFLDVDKRRTDFEIVDVAKVNPTSVTLKAVPHVKNYDPAPAFEWGIAQIRAVGAGIEPDQRLTSDIASDLAELAEREPGYGYKSFWINGVAEKVTFDDAYQTNALRLAAERRKKEQPDLKWHVGSSFGSIIGELKKLDDYEADKEFVIVPPAGKPVTCTFPDSMRHVMGQYWSKIVRVSGILKYEADSPFPISIKVDDGGVELYRQSTAPRTLAQLRGVFDGADRPAPDWDSLIHGR